MKNLLSIILITPLLFSCYNPKLEEEIKQLKAENRILKDSLKKFEYNKLKSSQLILIPHTLAFKKNKKTLSQGYFPKYKTILNMSFI